MRKLLVLLLAGVAWAQCPTGKHCAAMTDQDSVITGQWTFVVPPIGTTDGVTSINGTAGAYNFTGSVTCTGTTCNFTGSGTVGSGTANQFCQYSAPGTTCQGHTLVAGDIPNITESQVTNLTSDLSGKVSTSQTVNGHALSSAVTVTATDVGLGNANNTSDANKPVSTAQATAIATAQSTAEANPTTAGVQAAINGQAITPSSVSGDGSGLYNLPSGVGGSGTANYIGKWTASSTLGNSLLTDDGTTLIYTGTGGLSVPKLTVTGAGYTNFASQSDSSTTGDFWRNGTAMKFYDGSGVRTLLTDQTGATASLVNGSVVANLNLNATTPAAPANSANVAFQVSGANVSANIGAAGASLGVTKSGACSAGQHANGAYNSDGTPTCSVDTGGSAPTIDFFSFWPSAASTAGAAFTANKLYTFGFTLPTAMTPTTIGVRIVAVDNTANLYDFGIYNKAGTLQCHVGATAGSTLWGATNGYHEWAMASCPQLAAGTYFFAATTNAASGFATIAEAASGGMMGLLSTTANGNASTSGGVLGSTFVPSALAYTQASNLWWFLLHD